MGEVLAVLRIMPEDVEVDLEELKRSISEKIPEEVEIHKIEEEPIAFGLKALRITVIVSDTVGGTDPVEEAIREIDGVKSVEVVDLHRLL